MRLHVLLAVGVMQCCLLTGAAQQTAGAGNGTSAPPTQSAKPRPAGKAAENVGEKKFEQNCNRCHNAPQELSRRITGTVLLHMRVRASLSEADERAILHFLAP